jgi:hypothetical protein
MTDQVFPPEVPNLGDLLRITPIREEYVPNEYKFFCEEAYVVSRFFAIDHADRKFIVFRMGGEIREINFNIKNETWFIHFDNQRLQVEIEKILE